MSFHQPERKEKICLNCGTELYGRYCHHCGQENVEPKESFGHLVRHFFEDVTHFDGKFFITLKDLLFKPGFLSKEYIRGKRISYLHPIRMYVFTSFIFFLVLFSLNKKENDTSKDDKQEEKYSVANLQQLKDSLQKTIPLIKDSSDKKVEDKLEKLQGKIDDLSDTSSSRPTHEKYSNIQQYDSVQNTLPKNKKDNFFTRRITKWEILLQGKDEHNNKEFVNEAAENFQHKIPQLLFVSLPFFALLLMMLFHKRKDLYFADHGIFSIHLYIAYFIFILIILLLNLLPNSTFLSWLIIAFILLIAFYTYKSLKNFYGEGRWKTVLKLGILWFLHFFVMIFLFVIFAIIIFLII